MYHQQSYPQNETFFDAKIQAMNSTEKVCVMVNNNTKHTSKSPVNITGLSSPPNGNLSFYNSNTGSRVVDATVYFKYDIPECMTINEIINTGKKGTH